MKSFEISHLKDPTPEHAKQIIALTRQDLYEARVQDEKIKQIADPDNEQLVKNQLEKLKNNPHQYRAALNGADIIGISKVNEFYTGDLRPYLPIAQRPLNRMHELFNGGELDGHPLGILALVAAEDTSFDQYEIGEALVGDIVNNHPDNEIFVGLWDHDPLRPAFKGQGFEPTGLHGKPQPAKVRQELHLRKPD